MYADFCQQHTARSLAQQAGVLSWSQAFPPVLVFTVQWWRKCWLCGHHCSESVPFTGMICFETYHVISFSGENLNVPSCFQYIVSGWRRQHLDCTYFVMRKKRQRKQWDLQGTSRRNWRPCSLKSRQSLKTMKVKWASYYKLLFLTILYNYVNSYWVIDSFLILHLFFFYLQNTTHIQKWKLNWLRLSLLLWEQRWRKMTAIVSVFFRILK